MTEIGSWHIFMAMYSTNESFHHRAIKFSSQYKTHPHESHLNSQGIVAKQPLPKEFFKMAKKCVFL